MCLKQWLFENSVENEVGLTEIHNSFELASLLWEPVPAPSSICHQAQTEHGEMLGVLWMLLDP